MSGVVNSITGGIHEVFGRPGDLIHNPGKYIGSAAMGAAPFLAGPLAGLIGGAALPGWAAGLMSMGGSALAGNGQQQGGSSSGGNGFNLGNLAGSALPFALSQVGQPQYQDGGFGNNISDIARQLGSAGSGFLTQGQQGLPSLGSMGALGNMQGIMGQQASNAGVANPFTGQGGSTNPYSLMPHEQEAFNQTANMVNQGRQAAQSQLQSRLAANGIDDPRYMAAAQAQINSGHDSLLANTHSNLMNQAFQNRQNTLSGFAQQMPQLYGAQQQSQQNAIGNGAQMLHGAMGGYQGLQNASMNQYRYNQANLGQMAARLSQQGANPQQIQQLLQGMGSNTNMQNNDPNNPIWNGNLGGTPGVSSGNGSFETGDLPWMNSSPDVALNDDYSNW